MSRRDHSMTVALCLSLVAHALIVAGFAQLYARDMRQIRLAGWSPYERVIVIHAHAPDAPPKMKLRLGESDGRGDALDSAPGDFPLQAWRGRQVQAFLSLDDVGVGERHEIGDAPLASETFWPPRAMVGLTTPSQELIASAPRMRKDLLDRGTSQTAPAAGSSDESAASPAAPPPSISAAAAADPAPKGETASDPFTTAGSVEFRPGSTHARFGRKHKLVAPRLTLAGKRELLNLAPPITIVLRIQLDEAGNVTHSFVQKSSGSDAVDQACKLTSYKWWFEPKLDENRQPQRDEFLFTISFS